MNYLLCILGSALVSLLAVNWAYMKIIKIAKVKNIVDNPNARKLQKIPVPVLGGLAVFFGLIAGEMCADVLFEISGFTNEGSDLMLWSIRRGTLKPVLLGASIMLYVGAMDDTIGLTPRARIIAEMLVMLGLCFGSGQCVDSLYGLFGIYNFSWWIGIPLTVIAGIGIINAFNMVDGVNGLSSGLCITVSIFMGTYFWKRFDLPDASLAFCFAASLLPFLLHNVFGNRSRMFIGDAGTMVMGLLVSWCMIRTLSSTGITSIITMEQEMCLPAMLLAIASVPVMDTLRVIVERMCHGRSPFRGDRSHLHHKFMAIGVSHSITALSEVIIDMIVVGSWYLAYRLGMSQEMQLLVTFIVAAGFVWGTYAFLRFQEKYETALFGKLIKIANATHLGHRRWWLSLQKYLDKGAYEDMTPIVKEKFNIANKPLSKEENDTIEILNYLQGRKTTSVYQIEEESGVDKESIMPILINIEKNEFIIVTDRSDNGTIKSVRLLAY